MTDHLLDNITTKSLEILDNNIKMQSLTYDIMFKNLFKRNIYAFKRFIITVLHLDIEPEECNIYFLDNELDIINYKEKRKITDFNITINDSISVNIELNRKTFKNVKRRNHLYHNKQVSYSLKRGENIKNLLNYTNIQLNLNAYDKSSNLGEDIIMPYSLKTSSIYIENDIVYLRYLDYYYKLYYNKSIKKEESDYWLALLMSKSFTELNNILSQFLDNDLREKIVKDVLMLSMDKFILEECEIEALETVEMIDTLNNTREEGLKIGREEGLKIGHEEGRQEGREEGFEAGKSEIIKSMINNKLDYETISKISGKSIEEIKEIANSIKK